jgi:predicted nucleic acid-binding protein
VVDACVVAKWVLPDEEYLKAALKIRDDYVSGSTRLFAPSILRLEVASVLWKAVKLKRLTEEDSHESLQALLHMNIALNELDWLQTLETINVAYKLDIAPYDAAYLYVSKKIGAPLLTSDTKLYEKAKDHFRVVHLRDYI